MPISKTTGKSSPHASTARGGKKIHAPDCESLVRFAETLRLRSLADATRAEYLRFVRKLAARCGGDPATLDEAAVRAHLLRLKDEHHYSPSSMRTAVSAMRAFYGLHLGRDWKLFDLVRSPSAQKLPMVLTREEVARSWLRLRSVAGAARSEAEGEEAGCPRQRAGRRATSSPMVSSFVFMWRRVEPRAIYGDADLSRLLIPTCSAFSSSGSATLDAKHGHHET